MFKYITNPLRRSLLALVALSLVACASKVRLDDLPSVVDRGGNSTGSVYNPGQGATTAGVTNTDNSAGAGGALGGNAIKTVQAGGTNNASGAGSAADMAGLLAKRSIYFDYDSYDIRDEYKAVLLAHAKNLSTKLNVKVALEGHTDERGGAEYNLALGQKRANAVLQTLQTLGVNATQMEAVSFGKEKPKALGANEAGFAENRRVDIQYK